MNCKQAMYGKSLTFNTVIKLENQNYVIAKRGGNEDSDIHFGQPNIPYLL